MYPINEITSTLHFDRKKLSDDKLITLYTAMLKPRMIEEKMLNLLRQNKISKWFSGIGQEAVSVGITQALQMEEYIPNASKFRRIYGAKCAIRKTFCTMARQI